MTLTEDLSRAAWRKSSRSNSSPTECVELARLSLGVAVRDSVDPEGPKLMLSEAAWAEVLIQVRTSGGHISV
ncbi:DUF397 domain-containing protein [Spirillospora sp. NPDC052269]